MRAMSRCAGKSHHPLRAAASMWARNCCAGILLCASACEREANPTSGTQPAAGESVFSPAPGKAPGVLRSRSSPPPVPPPTDVGGLRPLSRADIERELEPGAGCSLDGDDQRGPLMVAVAGDAIINDAGKIVHLRSLARDLRELSKGGHFEGGGLQLEIEREHTIERMDEVTTWQATLRVARGPVGVTSFHHRWSCGA